MRFILILSLFLSICLTCHTTASAQELNANVTVNHQQVQQTSTGVFEALENALKAFMNERQWTNLQFKTQERINCNFAITITKYKDSENSFECKMTVQSSRPVFNSNYSTTVFNTQDVNFNFTFQEYDKLDFRTDVIDNDLTAMMAYYAYLIIGLDMDTMAPEGGTDFLRTAQTICNNAQTLTKSAKGWKAFDDGKNRYAIINDYLDNAMQPFRQMQYKYYREGLDIMTESPERGRAAITDALALLKQAHANKSLSMLPQLFTEYKRDELVGIYQGKGTAKDKESIYETLSSINASQNSYWNKLLK